MYLLCRRSFPVKKETGYSLWPNHSACTTEFLAYICLDFVTQKFNRSQRNEVRISLGVQVRSNGLLNLRGVVPDT